MTMWPARSVSSVGPGRGDRAAARAPGRFRAKGFLFHPFISRARGAAAPPGGALETCRYHVFDRTCVPGGRLLKVALLRRAGRVCGGGGGGGGARFHIYEGIA